MENNKVKTKQNITHKSVALRKEVVLDIRKFQAKMQLQDGLVHSIDDAVGEMINLLKTNNLV